MPFLESCLPAVTPSGRAQPWVDAPKLLGGPLPCPAVTLEGNMQPSTPLSHGLGSRQQKCLWKEVSGQFPGPGSWVLERAAGHLQGMTEAVSGRTLCALVGPWDRLQSGRAGVREEGARVSFSNTAPLVHPHFVTPPWPTVLSVNVGQEIGRAHV